MADFTRAELQAQIDALLVENGTNSITATQLNALMANLLANLTHQTEGDKETKVLSADVLDPAAGYMVNGVKVVGAQGAAIDHLTEDHTVANYSDAKTIVDGVSETINKILVALETHGLIGAPEV